MSIESAAEADFPPLVTGFRLRERADAHAEAIAQAPKAGAGSLFYVGRFDLIEFALVLEPEEPLRLARKIFYAGMNALAEALAVLSPAEKAIGFGFPGAMFFDGALIGGGRLAWPADALEERAPDWLVFSALLRGGGVRGQGAEFAPTITSLDDEGFEPWTPESVSASFARHFSVAVDQWHERGFRDIGPAYLERLHKASDETRRGIDENGDLLVHRAGIAGAERIPFIEKLAMADWYDPFAREPRGW